MRYVLTASVLLLFILVALFGWPAFSPPPVESAVLTDDSLTYHLHVPDATFALPRKLDEVSGLAYVDERTLAMVNDEAGKIYLWDRHAAAVVDAIDFGKDGDYEGVAVNGTTAYVLRSDGDVYEVTDFRQNPVTTKHENPLSDDNDAEGLFYEAIHRQLLIACKATGRTNAFPDADAVLIYRFSTDDPDTVIPDLTSQGVRVRPSGVAVHPRTGHYYLLSSADRQLLVFDANRSLRQSIDLPKKLFPQPEGICFTPEGTLYIANERRNADAATLLHFDPIL